MLALTDQSTNEALLRVNQYKSLAMVNFAKYVLPTDEEIEKVFSTVANAPCSAQALLEGIDHSRKSFVMRSLAWLLKLGVLRLV